MLKQLDMFGTKPKLTFEGEAKYRTKIGVLITIICNLLISFLFFYFSIDLIYKRNSKVTYNTVFNNSGSLDFSEVPFMMTMVKGLKLPDNYTRYFQMGAYMMEYFVYNGTSVGTKREIALENCNINKHFGKYTYLFKNVAFLESHFCAVPGQLLNVQGSALATDVNYTQLALFAVRCTNTTTKNDCYPIDTINNYLQSISWSMITLNHIFDPNNYTDPGQVYLYKEKGQVGTTMFKRADYLLSNVDYLTDKGIFYETIERQDYFTISDPTYSADLRTVGLYPGSFASINIEFRNFKISYERSYIKLQNVIANVGGFIKFIFFVGKIISGYFSNFYFHRDLINFLFQVESCSNYYQFPIALMGDKIQLQNLNDSGNFLKNTYIENKKLHENIKSDNVINNNYCEQKIEKIKTSNLPEKIIKEKTTYATSPIKFNFNLLWVVFRIFVKPTNFDLFTKQVNKMGKALSIKNLLLLHLGIEKPNSQNEKKTIRGNDLFN
jgi:hypothetical protein